MMREGIFAVDIAENKMLSVNSKKPYILKVAFVIILHLMFSQLTNFFFFADDISMPYQVVQSFVHSVFIYIAIRWLIAQYRFSIIPKMIGLALVVVFVILNLLPKYQGIELHDSGFVPLWSTSSQTMLGWPNVFLRIYEPSLIHDEELGSYLIQFDNWFLNIYILTIFVALQLKLTESKLRLAQTVRQ